MRVRFGDLSNEERAHRERVLALAREAWTALEAGEAELACSVVARIDPRLRLSVGVHESATCAELIPLDASAWPLSELCLGAAPRDLACALALGRAARPLEQALLEARASYGVSLRGSSLRAGFGRGHLLEITLGVPGGTGAENEQNAAEYLVRAVLGDRLFETWIGAVHVTSAPRGGPLRVLDTTAPRHTLGLHELYDTVAAAARGVLLGLPDEATGRAVERLGVRESRDVREDDDSRAEWTLLETEPLAVVGATTPRKRDLLLASTCTPELLRCYLDDAPCASLRFSSRGERFVFVSYADDRASMSERVARRASIEAALTSGLRGVGRVTGVGIGVRTSYVDLALCNLETTLPRLVANLRELALPPRSFIEFFDSELSEEWLSVWPDARLTDS